MQTVTTKPTWEETWAGIGSEDMLAAKALIELSGDLTADARQWLGYEQRPVYASDHWSAEQIGTERGEALFLWEEWLADVDARDRGWCSSAGRLFQVVASLLDPDRPLLLRRALSYSGSWEVDVWRILTEWGTGGNNRETRGRATVVTR